MLLTNSKQVAVAVGGAWQEIELDIGQLGNSDMVALSGIEGACWVWPNMHAPSNVVYVCSKTQCNECWSPEQQARQLILWRFRNVLCARDNKHCQAKTGFPPYEN